MFLHKFSPIAPPLWLAAGELEMPPVHFGRILLYALHVSHIVGKPKPFGVA